MNLSEVVIRAEDTWDTLADKVELATIIGTIQSTYTHMPYLRDIWKENTEEERLLGVSLTGILDNPNLQDAEGLNHMRIVAATVNKLMADQLGIPRSMAITCVKPSGTVSQLVDSASGIHPRHSKHYIRRVRGDNKDPMTQFMKDQGIPAEVDVMKPKATTVFSFPVAAPEGAMTRDDLTPIDHLNIWLKYQRHWCEHKPSATINVPDDQWDEVAEWVWRNFDEVSGVSFLPHDGGSYKQAPYEEITREEYEEMKKGMPESIDWTRLSDYEKEDTTVGMQTMACSGDVCEIVDIG